MRTLRNDKHRPSRMHDQVCGMAAAVPVEEKAGLVQACDQQIGTGCLLQYEPRRRSHGCLRSPFDAEGSPSECNAKLFLGDPYALFDLGDIQVDDIAG